MPSPKVAVVVPVHGRLPKTLRFIESFRRVEYDSYQIVIVDDASPDGTAAVLARDHPDVVGAARRRQAVVDGRHEPRRPLRPGSRLRLCADDQQRHGHSGRISSPAWWRRPSASAAASSAAGFISSISPTRVWGVGGATNWRRGDIVAVCERDADEAELLARRANPAEVELLTGCGTLVPTACYREIGLYDRRMFPHYHSDSELTLRAARRGWRILVDLRSVVYVDESNPTWRKSLFWLGSPMYWRPLLAMHLRYCPRRAFAVVAGAAAGPRSARHVRSAKAGDSHVPAPRLRATRGGDRTAGAAGGVTGH